MTKFVHMHVLKESHAMFGLNVRKFTAEVIDCFSHHDRYNLILKYCSEKKGSVGGQPSFIKDSFYVKIPS